MVHPTAASRGTLARLPRASSFLRVASIRTTSQTFLTLRPSAPSHPLQAPPAARPRSSRARPAVTRAAVSAPCDLVECGAEFADVRVATVNGKTVSAAALRAVDVLSPSGATVTLGDEVGAKGVLVLLRHLG